jgi:hypothetical protein
MTSDFGTHAVAASQNALIRSVLNNQITSRVPDRELTYQIVGGGVAIHRQDA